MKQNDRTRDVFMLKGVLAKKGYDWWWHNFTGYRRSDGEKKSFFIEYFVCNPALGTDHPVLGQLPCNQEHGVKPSYALVKAGWWGQDAQQLHNFYAIRDFHADPKTLAVRIGGCVLTETQMRGSCSVQREDAEAHPEYMSGWGTMSWDLQIQKQIAFNVGYGASAFMRRLNAFEMFWHAQGIKTQYSGEVYVNNEVYDILPERSSGYADKNWGKDFTSPWVWVSSCNLKSTVTGKALLHSAVEMGGGNPRVYGLSLGRQLLGCLYYEGTRYEYNFSKFWTGSKTDFSFAEGSDVNTWTIDAVNRTSRMELTLSCRKSDMLFMNYESPDGRKRHNRLWNGGTGYGTIRLYVKDGREWKLLDNIEITDAGCEYGEYGDDTPPAGISAAAGPV
jgi:hypothetical protein